MRYAKKSPEALQLLRHTLLERLAQAQPNVAEAARWIRESTGLNQRDFAKLIGLSTPQIARLERGEANPTLETLLAVGKPYRLQIGFIHPDMRLSQDPQMTQGITAASQAQTSPRPLPLLDFQKLKNK